MTITIDLIACVYFAINIFFGGRFYEHQRDDVSWLDVLIVIGMCLFFTPGAICVLVYEGIKWALTIFQIQFWFIFWFGKKFRPVTMEQYNHSEIAVRYHKKETFRDRMFRRSVLALQKRYEKQSDGRN